MTPWIQFCAACAGLNKRRHTCDIPPPSRRTKERRAPIRIPGVFAPGYDGPSGTPDTTQPNDDHLGTIGDNGKIVGVQPGAECGLELEEHFFEQGIEEVCDIDVFDHARQAM